MFELDIAKMDNTHSGKGNGIMHSKEDLDYLTHSH
jgi:hypothetical protein